MTTPPLALNKKQTAEQLSTSERNIDLQVADGKFPLPVVFGSSPRWRYEELREWINAGMPPTAEWIWPIPEPDQAS